MRCVTALREALSWIFCNKSNDKSHIAEFKQCCELVAIRRAGGEIDDADFWQLYGYFKQAMVGDFNIGDTSEATEIELLKWSQWKKHKGMSKRDAIQTYINLVRERYGHAEESDTGYDSMPSAYSRMKINEDDTAVSNDDEGFLTIAAENHLGMLRMLLKAKPSLANFKTPEGLTALHIAADRGHKDIIKCLLDHGSDVNAMDDHGDTAILIAAESRNRFIVKLLLNAGANPFIRNVENVCANDLMTIHPSSNGDTNNKG